jgi:hypothetical protein
MIAFYITLGILLFIVAFLDKKYCMLRDITRVTEHPPYSWSRVQMAWWTVLILSSFIAILIQKGDAPTLHGSELILLGISAATTATARMIDLSDEQRADITRHQDSFGKNFILDILSDQSGPSIHRLQAVIFNAVFGVWFVYKVVQGLNDVANDKDNIMPVISENNLILLGLSSATYAALKTTENKVTPATNKNTGTGVEIKKDGSVG